MSWLQRVTGPPGPVRLDGRAVLVVGGTAGVGEALGRRLAVAGARTIVLGRDVEKLARLKAELQRLGPAPIETHLADLADLASVQQAAEALNSLYDRLDIVVANAGVLYTGSERRFTRDGFELTFGVNHLGTAALLLGLAPVLTRSSGARVVIVASEAHRRAKGLPLDDLMGERAFDATRAYNRSKLANILFVRELATRWRNQRIGVHAAHPGGVDTGMLKAAVLGGGAPEWLYRRMRPLLLSADEAAAGILRIATDPALGGTSGDYFELGRLATSSRDAADPTLAAALWDASAGLLAEVAQSSRAAVP